MHAHAAQRAMSPTRAATRFIACVREPVVAVRRVQRRAAKRDPGRGSIHTAHCCVCLLNQTEPMYLDRWRVLHPAPQPRQRRRCTKHWHSSPSALPQARGVAPDLHAAAGCQGHARLHLLQGKEREEILPAQMTTVSTASMRFFPATEISSPSSQMRSYEQPLMLSTALSCTKPKANEALAH